MIRTLLLCLSMLLVGGVVQAQNAPAVSSGFSFKGNYLGMLLTDFKAANPGVVWINTGDPNRRRDKKLDKDVATPLCTDTYRGFEFDSGPLESGVVLCNASPGVANPEGKVIMGQKAIRVIYLFCASKLYRIEISVLPIDYDLVASGLREKYGEPDKVEYEHFQNGFGASWKGEELIWKNGSQRIATVEGSGNGPGQDRFDSTKTSGIFMEDDSLAPPHTARLKVDF